MTLAKAICASTINYICRFGGPVIRIRFCHTSKAAMTVSEHMSTAIRKDALIVVMTSVNGCFAFIIPTVAQKSLKLATR